MSAANRTLPVVELQTGQPVQQRSYRAFALDASELCAKAEMDAAVKDIGRISLMQLGGVGSMTARSVVRAGCFAPHQPESGLGRRQICSTLMRVPRITGLSIMILGRFG
jgi:hypothetical protein